jgi:rhodanese-related sulfurtransferase
VLDLRKKGFQNAVALLGGMEAWKNAGLPVDKVQ